MWLTLFIGVLLGIALTLGAAAVAAWYVIAVVGKKRVEPPSVSASGGGATTPAVPVTAVGTGASKPALPSRSTRTDWPPVVIRMLRTALEAETAKESAKWLDTLFMRFFLELRKSDLYKERIRRKLLQQLQKKIAQTGFVKNITVTGINFGDIPPRLEGVQLVQDKSLNEDLLVQIDLDIVYRGGFTISIEVELAAGLFVPVTILVSGFKGKLRFRVPRPENGTEFNMSFVDDPNLSLQVQSRFVRNDSEYSLFQNQLNSFLAKKLKQVFVDSWTLPTWRFFDLPLVSMPTFVHPNCKCNLNAPIKPIGDLAPVPPSSSTPSLFTISATPFKECVVDLSEGLLHRVLQVVQDTGANDWQVVKNKNGVLVQKEKRRLTSRDDAQIVKGTVAIRCDPKRVFHILANPQLNRHIDPDYVGYYNLEDYGEGQMLRNFGYRKRDTVVFEVARKLSNAPLDTWVMAQRSMQIPADTASGFDASKHQRSLVYLFAYHVEAIAGDKNVCTVVCMSQMAPNMKNQNVSWQRLVDIRQIIEQLLARSKHQTHVPSVRKPTDTPTPNDEKPTISASTSVLTTTTTQLTSSSTSSIRDVNAIASSSIGETQSLPLSVAQEQPPLSLDDAQGLTTTHDDDGMGSNDEENNNDDDEHVEDDEHLGEATTSFAETEDDHLMDDEHISDGSLSQRVSSGSIAPRAAGSQAPVPLSMIPKVTSDTYKDITKETLEYFLAYARRENDGLYLKPWRPVKATTVGLSIQRKLADESIPADVIRGTIVLTCAPQSVFTALKGPRYRSVANPDLVTCDTLTAYEDGIATRHYRYKGSLLPDRDCVVLEIAQQISSHEWIVIQRSVSADDLAWKESTLRFQVHISGYYIQSTPSAQPEAGAHTCVLTHVNQLSADYTSVLLSWLRVGWARNLPRVKYALERSSESVASAILPRETTAGYSDGVVKAGGLMWVAISHHSASFFSNSQPLDTPEGTKDPVQRYRRGQLVWEFTTRNNDIRFGVVFVPNVHQTIEASSRPRPAGSAPAGTALVPVAPRIDQVNLSSKDLADRIPPWEGKGRSVLPSAPFNAHICPVSGSVNASLLYSGTYYLVWDNRFARFTDKQVTYKATIVYSTVEWLPEVDDDVGQIARTVVSGVDVYENTSNTALADVLPQNEVDSMPTRPLPDAVASVGDGTIAPATLNDLSPAFPSQRRASIPRGSTSGVGTPLATPSSAPPVIGNFSLPPPSLPLMSPSTATTGRGSVPSLPRRVPTALTTVPPIDQAISGDAVIYRKEAMRVPLDLQVPWDQVRLVWEFRSGKDDIEFSIIWEEYDVSMRPIILPSGETRRTPILPITRISPASDQESVSGELVVSAKPGRYMFVWDNNFSRWRSKNLSFSVALVASSSSK